MANLRHYNLASTTSNVGTTPYVPATAGLLILIVFVQPPDYLMLATYARVTIQLLFYVTHSN